jgi:aldehyde:ferredoxin oxidoreductase
MKKLVDTVLYVDLAKGSYEVVESPELFEKFLGGSGLAIELLLKECPQGIDPFAPENPVVLAPGPFCGLFPSGGKTVATFKSPLTGNLGESHAGGRMGTCLRLAGFGALVVRNSAPNPTFLEISGKDVSFYDASPLKGSSTSEVERRLRECAKVARMQSIASIGPAGESRVSYACVNVDRYNCFGRLGLGAVFGSKNLKALSIIGSGSIEVPNAKLYKEAFRKLYDEEIETDKMAKYHFLGTPANVLPINEIKALPTRNFQQGSFECADAISGETLAKNCLDRKVSCPLCPIGCMHIARLREAFAPGYEFEPIDVYNNFESIYALGSNLCVKNPEEVLRLIHRANILGIDTMLIGNVLAWATEAFEKGLIGKAHTKDVTPKWGETEAYLSMMDHVALKANEFYAKLAQGLDKAAESYGGEEFAMTLGGNGLSGYYTGYASLLGTVVGSRHSHNNNAGYDIDQRGLHQDVEPKQIVNELRKENEWRYVLTSLVICLFARRVYTEKRVVEALEAVGIERSAKDLEKLGSEIYKRAFQFKFREGFDFDKVKFPRRIFESPTANGKLKEEVFRDMLEEYVKNEFGLTLQK